ncbi:hypothetical protein HaLaN_18359 [Haematococcus lacustris]|uniref:Uncharacterized protein n=1 Tax=Haematococcus lacustris TaxID=44745 RepID=A0A699ZNA1_HAELA|nr:hypothetical protein HaLaN_18359 [Haematococcus lacustris]
MLGPDAPAGARVSTAVTATASPALVGTFRVAMGPWCDEVEVDVSDPPDMLSSKLSKLPYMAGRT